jgi:hypothetical protein
MTIEQSLIQREASLIAKVREYQSGIDDRTGKGGSGEQVIEEQLVRPFLPAGFDCGKGSVVTADDPATQSPAIDRIVFDRAASMPLISAPEHSVFPIEVAGLAQITLRLDATKLAEDIRAMHPVKAMTTAGIWCLIQPAGFG